MLYKLIIVDDEARIRKGLRNFVDWNNLGFEVAADFEDGKETIEYINDYNVDVILTDIRMAEVSGIELTKYIYEKGKNIKVILLTGYKEFEYAKQAIEYGVYKYLLKPVDIEETCRTFESIKTQLDEEKAQVQISKDEFRALEELSPMLRRQFFYDIFTGILRKKDDIKKRASLIGLETELEHCSCCVVDVQISNYEAYLNNTWEYGNERFKAIVQDFIEDFQKRLAIYTVYSSKSMLKIMAVSSEFKDPLSFKAELQNCLEKIKAQICLLWGIELKYSTNSCHESIFDFANEFQKLISRNIYDKSASVREMVGDDGYDTILEKYKLIADNISLGSKENIRNIFNSFIDELQELPRSCIEVIVFDLFMSISMKFSSMGIQFPHILSTKLDRESLARMKEIMEIRRCGLEVLDSIADYAVNHKEDASKLMIRKAKDYLEENHSRDISLEDVANHVFLSAAYFSRFFKQNTGENFTDFLLSIRIKHALQLLSKGNFKIYEVGELVGYRNAKYFIRQFKQYTGYTPKDYCVKVLKAGENIEDAE